MKRKHLLLILWISLSLTFGIPAIAQSYTLSLETTSDGTTKKTAFLRGDTLYLNIVVDDVTGIAGCAFTLTYPADSLTAPQISTDAATLGLPVNAGEITSFFTFTKDNTTYQIHRENVNITGNLGKIFFSGASIDTITGGAKSSSGPTVLFKVKFTVKSDAPLKNDNVFSLLPTTLNNTQAGYSAEGETVPVLIGAVDKNHADWNTLTAAFPVLLQTISGITKTYEVVAPSPVIPNPPTSGSAGSSITLNGSNFGATQGSGYVDFNGRKGTIISWSDTQIVVGVPAGATSGCMKIVTDYGESDCIDFTVTSATLYGTFTGNGIWKWNGSAWNQLTPDNPVSIVASGTNLYANFSGSGIWQWNGTGWTHLTPDNPEAMVASGTDLYGDFGNNGLWKWNGTGWTLLTPDNPAAMVASGSNLYGNFTGNGIWQWNGNTWNQLTPDNPEAMVASGADLYGDFENSGLWKWNGTGWSHLTPDNPSRLAASSTSLYGSFSNSGIWEWNGSGWTLLTPDTPALMAVGE